MIPHLNRLIAFWIIPIAALLAVGCSLVTPAGNGPPNGGAGNAADVLLARDSARTISLADFAGQTYLQAMQAANHGIYEATMADDGLPVTVASADQVVGDINEFDPRIGQRLSAMFDVGLDGIHSTAQQMQGKLLSPQQIGSVLANNISSLKPDFSTNDAAAICSPIFLLTSGSGTLVKIRTNNYFYNVAYQTPNVKSGRNYAVAPTRSLLDPSDNDYLQEMGNFLKSAAPGDISNFYTTIFNILCNCNSSNYAGVNPTGQVVLTDFLAIYTAELIRHNMVGLSITNHPWEIDIGEVTLIGAYGAASGMVMTNGNLVPGDPTVYYGKGKSGSGIGDTRADFTRLATLITSYENAPGHHPEIIERLIQLTPMQPEPIQNELSGDIFRRVLVFLNQPEYQSVVQQNAETLTSAILILVNQIQVDQSEITLYVKETPNNHSTTGL